MPKFYGEMVADNKMRVDIISYSGNKPGGVEVEEVLEGEGTHYVDPQTGEQWFEFETEEEESAITKLQAKVDELNAALQNLKEGQNGVGN